MSKDSKKALVPKLRFPEFQKDGVWTEDVVANLVETVTPPKKLQTSEYSLIGRFPIIDQSKDHICGRTDDETALIKNDLPLIIFGDHTCALKLVTEPFAQGADGIKILRVHKQVDPQFLFQCLQHNPVEMEQYKRHFSILKEKVVFLPPGKNAKEQRKIANCLSSLDDLISAQSEKITALKTYKKGLLQQLFPQEGETVPRLRFPEFRKDGEWVEKSINDISPVVTAGGTPSTSEPKYWGGGIRWMNSGELNLKRVHEVQGRITELGLNNSSTKIIPPKCILIGLAGQGKTRGTVAMNMVELCTNQSIAAIFPNELLFDSEFLYHNLDGRYDELRRLSAGDGGRGGLNLQIIKNLKIHLPKSKREQKKIADCLSSLDDLICSEESKLEYLKAHKKGLLQQLFPSLTEDADE